MVRVHRGTTVPDCSRSYSVPLASLEVMEASGGKSVGERERNDGQDYQGIKRIPLCAKTRRHLFRLDRYVGAAATRLLRF